MENQPTENLESSQRTEGARAHLQAIGLALSGGVFGIFGAFIQEAQAGLVAILAAPIIEEALKPAGVYLMLAKWPRLLRSRLYTAFLSAVGGIAFSIIANIIYLYWYFPDHSSTMVFYRFALATPMHALASFIFGFGINQRLLASVKGEVPFLSGSKKYFVVAMVLHATYNFVMIILGAAGVIHE